MTDPVSHLPDSGAVGEGFPDPWPQPGIASMAPPYPVGAEHALHTPSTQPFNMKNWAHWEHVIALGLQKALSHPHIRAIYQDAIYKVSRGSFQPSALQPWVERPYRAENIGTIQNGATVAASDTTTLWTYTVPKDSMGVIKTFGHDVSEADAWDNITWGIKIGGAYIHAPMGTFKVQIGQTESPLPTTILIPPGQTIEIEAVNAAGDAYTANLAVLGWQWQMPDSGDIDNAQGHSTVA